MAQSEDTRTSMSYMDHLRSIALAGVRLIEEKTRTYGPSWKRRRGPGAWFTTVRPWDRLETIVDRYDGDIFAAIEAQPMGEDGSALACIRDTRNYLLLIEAEMVARGTIVGPLPQAEEDLITTLRPPLYAVSTPEGVELVVDTARASSVDDMEDTQQSRATLGTGPVADGRYTILDLGQSSELWAVGLGAVPSPWPGPQEALFGALCTLAEASERLTDAGALVASRRLINGDAQVLIRIPCSR